MRKVLDLATVLLALLTLLAGAQEECEVKRQRRCRQGLLQELDRVPDLDVDQQRATHRMEVHCRKLRENLNCLVLQVTRCPIPNRSGDLIQRTWKYMQDNCDTFGGWWNYECFHLEQVKKCEKIFALRDGSATCREYDRFRHCTNDVLQKHCDVEDEKSLGNYLLDSAGDMVWTCPHQAGPETSPIVDEGFVGVVKPKKKILPLEKLAHLDQHAPLLAVLPPLDPVPKQPGIAVAESHLTGVYSSSLTGNPPFVTGCNARATEEMRGCLDRHQYERDQALGAKEDEDRLRKECCATWNYRKCLQNAVRIHCYDTREVDVQSAIDVIPHDRGFLCRNHWIYTCSGAQHTFSPLTVAVVSLCALVVFAVQGAIIQRSI